MQPEGVASVFTLSRQPGEPHLQTSGTGHRAGEL